MPTDPQSASGWVPYLVGLALSIALGVVTFLTKRQDHDAPAEPKQGKVTAAMLGQLAADDSAHTQRLARHDEILDAHERRLGRHDQAITDVTRDTERRLDELERPPRRRRT